MRLFPVGSIVVPKPVRKAPLKVARGRTKYHTLLGSIGSSHEKPKQFVSMSGNAVFMSPATPFTDSPKSYRDILVNNSQ